MAGGTTSRDVIDSKATRMEKGTLFSLFALIVTRLATVVNSIIMVRTLGPNDFGIYSIVLLTLSVVAIFATFGVPQAIVKFLSALSLEETQRASRLFGAGLALTVSATALTVSAAILLAPFLGVSLYGSPSVSQLLIVALLGLVINSVISPAASLFQAFERIREMSIRNVGTAILSISVTLPLVVLYGLSGAVWATVINSGLAVFVNLSLLRGLWRHKRLELVIPRSPSEYREILNYALPAFAGGLLVTPALWFGSTLLISAGTFVDLGQYSAAFGLSSYLLFIPSAIGIPLVPILSRLDRLEPGDFSTFLTKTFRVSTFLLLPPGLILLAFPDVFLGFLYGSEFVDAAPLVRLMVPAVFLAGVTSIFGYGIAGTGRMWHGLLLNVTWGIALIMLSILLVPASLARGLATSYLVAYGLLFVEAFLYARRTWFLNPRDLTPPMLLASLSLFGVEGVASLLFDPWRVPATITMIAAAVLAEFALMSRREAQVLSEPIRRLVVWINPPY